MGRPMLPRPICAVCGGVCKTRGRTFCSYECRAASERGKEKPHARGNKWAFRGASVSKWAQYKRMQKLCPPGPCVECGSTEMSIIHHVDHDAMNTVPSNLIRMCRSCHARHHHTKAA